MPDAFLDDDEDGVIAGNRTENLGQIAVVDVPGNTAGIARARLDDADVPGEVDADESRHLHHLPDTVFQKTFQKTTKKNLTNT